MKKIKSAFELAMEKTAPEKSREQLEREKEELKNVELEKYVKAAAILGRSFLQGKSKQEEILAAFERYPEKARQKAQSAFLEEVVAGLNLNNTPAVLKVIDSFRKDEAAQKACAELQSKYDDFQAELREQLRELQENAGSVMAQMLEQRGIRGSAISGFNVKKMEQWDEITAQIENKYQEAVDSFRKVLVQK